MLPIEARSGPTIRAARGGARRAAARAAAARPESSAPVRRCRSTSGCRTCGAAREPGRFSFDEAVRGADRVTEAVTLFALLELYKAGEALRAGGALRPDRIRWGRGRRLWSAVNTLARVVEALLFLSPEPVSVGRLAEACEVQRARSWRPSRACGSTTPRAGAGCFCARWRGASRWPPIRWPSAPPAACWRARARRRSPRRRPSASPSWPTCSQSPGRSSRASAGWPRSRGRHAAGARPRGGVGALSLRCRALPDYGAVREAVRAHRSGRPARPVTLRPVAEDERELRDRLMRAGEQRRVQG